MNVVTLLNSEAFQQGALKDEQINYAHSISF
jgi:hypothetical protein